MGIAAVLVKGKKGPKAFEMREWTIPTVGPTQVKIASESFGLNYADVMASNGLYREAPPRPCVIGYELVGKVIEVGAEVDASWLGKRVLAFCRFGGYAQVAVTESNAIVEVGNEPSEELLALATQGVTAWYMSNVLLNIAPKERVLIHAAAGGVGTMLIQLAKKRGAFVIAKVGGAEKAELVDALGADQVINYHSEDYSSVLSGQQNQVDISYNAVAGDTFKKDLKILAPGGRLVLFGGAQLSSGKYGIFSALNFLRKMGRPLPIGLMMTSKSILGVNMLKIADRNPALLQGAMQEVYDRYSKKELSVQVGGVFPIEKLKEAHELLSSGKSQGKIAVKWT